MRYPLAFGVSLVCLLAGPTAHGQGVQINRTNKTIEVEAKATVWLDPDYAAIKLGYSNYGRNQQAALEESARVGNQIIQSLLDAGLPKENIETEKIQISRVSAEDKDKWPDDIRKERQFEAQQSWTIRTAASDAQGIVSLAIGKGATEVEDVSWFLANMDAADSKANATALSRARVLAEQMAKNAGVKLGELLYVSNSTGREQFIEQFWLRRLYTRADGADLKLYPAKIKRDGEVRAVFVLE